MAIFHKKTTMSSCIYKIWGIYALNTLKSSSICPKSEIVFNLQNQKRSSSIYKTNVARLPNQIPSCWNIQNFKNWLIAQKQILRKWNTTKRKKTHFRITSLPKNWESKRPVNDIKLTISFLWTFKPRIVGHTLFVFDKIVGA